MADLALCPFRLMGKSVVVPREPTDNDIPRLMEAAGCLGVNCMLFCEPEEGDAQPVACSFKMIAAAATAVAQSQSSLAGLAKKAKQARQARG
ncbi:MAG: hypothetical protein ACYTKD_12945 [Planctomycetota bacterium]|jgi:hypothetical protein